MNKSREAEVLIVGGGINGVAIARDAAMRGYRVTLLEARDLCYGTSAGSSRLIHGGYRYMEYADLGLVRESLQERDILLAQRPWRVRRLTVHILCRKGDRWSSTSMLGGLYAYQLLALRWPFNGDVGRNRPWRLAETFEGLALDGVTAGLFFFDGQVRYPERLVMELWGEAEAAGAHLRIPARVERWLVEEGRVVGVELTDGERVRGGVVVNATGHWADAVAARSGDTHLNQLVTTRGSHIMLPRRPGMPDEGLYSLARRDARPFFVIPWGDSLWVGTTDIFHDDPDHYYATDDEIDYLLEECNQLFSDARYRREEIVLTRCGVRPLVRKGTLRSERSVSRAHRVVRPTDPDGRAGLMTILGGKLTTHRALAEEAVDMLATVLGPRGHCATAESVHATPYTLPEALPAKVAARLEAVYGPVCASLCRWFEEDPSSMAPLVPELPVLRAEVLLAFREEHAKDLDDLFARRTLLTSEDLPWWSHTDALAAAVAEILGWSPEGAQEAHRAWMIALAEHDPFTAGRIAGR